MHHEPVDTSQSNVLVVNAEGSSSVVLVCEHASNYMPPSFKGLGLSQSELKSHAAWDPGAMAVAEQIAKRLNATLIATCVSRLIYDCNRPPDAPGAMPVRSEVIEVPGNIGLSQSAREARAETYYKPFHAAIQHVLQGVGEPILVTIHSFTPVYHGVQRDVEIGILHDVDARLADAMLQIATTHSKAVIRRNAPYGLQDGVTHTLNEHGVSAGYMNVMIEVRNDLIKTSDQQVAMGNLIAEWIADACVQMNAPGDVQCLA